MEVVVALASVVVAALGVCAASVGPKKYYRGDDYGRGSHRPEDVASRFDRPSSVVVGVPHSAKGPSAI